MKEPKENGINRSICRYENGKIMHISLLLHAIMSFFPRIKKWIWSSNIITLKTGTVVLLAKTRNVSSPCMLGQRQFWFSCPTFIIFKEGHFKLEIKQGTLLRALYDRLGWKNCKKYSKYSDLFPRKISSFMGKNFIQTVLRSLLDVMWRETDLVRIIVKTSSVS